MQSTQAMQGGNTIFLQMNHKLMLAAHKSILHKQSVICAILLNVCDIVSNSVHAKNIAKNT